MSNNNKIMANMGWQCPRCLVVYSPSVEKCECSALPKVSLSGGGIVGVSSGLGITTTSSTTTMCSGYISKSHDGICSKCGNPKWNHPTYT
jgi:hypothetical protein